MKITIWRKNDSRESFSALDLSVLLDHFKTGRYRKPVTLLRHDLVHMPAYATPVMLKQLPRVIFPAVIRKKETLPLLARYNGVVVLTFKGLLGMEEAGSLRDQVGRLPQTQAAFIGASGRTVKVLVAFTLPDGALPRSEEAVRLFHAHAFRWAVAFYSGQFPNYTIRTEPPGYRQVCRVTYDPQLYCAVAPFPIRMEQPTDPPGETTYRERVAREKDPLRRMLPGWERTQILSHLYETSLHDALLQTGKAGKEEDPTELMRVLAGNCFRSGLEEETAVRYTLREFRGALPEVAVRQLFRNFYLRTTGFGGAPVLPPAQLLALRTDEFMNRRYIFRFNSQKGVTEYMERHALFYEFRPLTDRVMNTIALEAMQEGINLWDKDVKRWVNSHRVPVYAPVEDYLFCLPRWEGRDHIRKMAARVPCGNSRWPDLFYRWFLSMVAHWSRRLTTYANATSPLLVGGQGTGKSTFCRQLLPPELREYYTDSIDFGRKRDAELFLNRFALINMDEFDQITPSQQGFLKHILQKPVVNTRKPNQSAVTELRRYASFIATSNHADLLTDTSGSRRFIGVAVTGKIDNHTPVNYQQLYAQAVYALRRDVRYWFTPEEEAELTRANREFEKPDILEQLFLHYYRVAEEGEPCEVLSPMEILTAIRRKSRMVLPPGKLTYFGRLLKKLGARSKRSARGTLYFVIGREQESSLLPETGLTDIAD